MSRWLKNLLPGKGKKARKTSGSDTVIPPLSLDQEDIARKTAEFSRETAAEQISVDDLLTAVPANLEAAETVGDQLGVVAKVEQKVSPDVSDLRRHNRVELKLAEEIFKRLQADVKKVSAKKSELEETIAKLNQSKVAFDSFDGNLEALVYLASQEDHDLINLIGELSVTEQQFGYLTELCKQVEDVSVAYNKHLSQAKKPAAYKSRAAELRSIKENAIRMSALFEKKKELLRGIIVHVQAVAAKSLKVQKEDLEFERGRNKLLDQQAEKSIHALEDLLLFKKNELTFLNARLAEELTAQSELDHKLKSLFAAAKKTVKSLKSKSITSKKIKAKFDATVNLIDLLSELESVLGRVNSRYQHKTYVLTDLDFICRKLTELLYLHFEVLDLSEKHVEELLKKENLKSQTNEDKIRELSIELGIIKSKLSVTTRTIEQLESESGLFAKQRLEAEQQHQKIKENKGKTSKTLVEQKQVQSKITGELKELIDILARASEKFWVETKDAKARLAELDQRFSELQKEKVELEKELAYAQNRSETEDSNIFWVEAFQKLVAKHKEEKENYEFALAQIHRELISLVQDISSRSEAVLDLSFLDNSIAAQIKSSLELLEELDSQLTELNSFEKLYFKKLVELPQLISDPNLLKEETARINDDISFVKSEIKRVLKLISACEEKIDSLVDETKSISEAFTKTRIMLLRRVSEYESLISELMLRIASLTGQLQEEHSKFDVSKGEVAKSQKDYGEVVRQIDLLRAEVIGSHNSLGSGSDHSSRLARSMKLASDHAVQMGTKLKSAVRKSQVSAQSVLSSVSLLVLEQSQAIKFLRENVSILRGDLASSDLTIQELSEGIDNYVSLLDNQNEDHKSKIASLTQQHETKLADLTAAHAGEIARMNQQHELSVAALTQSNEQSADGSDSVATRITKLTEHHVRQIEDLQIRQGQRIAELGQAHAVVVAELKRQAQVANSAAGDMGRELAESQQTAAMASQENIRLNRLGLLMVAKLRGMREKLAQEQSDKLRIEADVERLNGQISDLSRKLLMSETLFKQTELELNNLKNERERTEKEILQVGIENQAVSLYFNERYDAALVLMERAFVLAQEIAYPDEKITQIKEFIVHIRKLKSEKIPVLVGVLTPHVAVHKHPDSIIGSVEDVEFLCDDSELITNREILLNKKEISFGTSNESDVVIRFVDLRYHEELEPSTIRGLVPSQFCITHSANGYCLENKSGTGMIINTDSVKTECILNDGDVIWLDSEREFGFVFNLVKKSNIFEWEQFHINFKSEIKNKTPKKPIVAIGDIHGDFFRLANVLKQAKIINNNLDWIGGKKVVFIGDYVDRGGQTFMVLDLLKHLKSQAPADEFVMLCGNHEGMFLGGLSGMAAHNIELMSQWFVNDRRSEDNGSKKMFNYLYGVRLKEYVAIQSVLAELDGTYASFLSRLNPALLHAKVWYSGLFVNDYFKFLKESIQVMHVDSNILFVHAGIPVIKKEKRFFDRREFLDCCMQLQSRIRADNIQVSDVFGPQTPLFAGDENGRVWEWYNIENKKTKNTLFDEQNPIKKLGYVALVHGHTEPQSIALANRQFKQKDTARYNIDFGMSNFYNRSYGGWLAISTEGKFQIHRASTSSDSENKSNLDALDYVVGRKAKEEQVLESPSFWPKWARLKRSKPKSEADSN
ncbi:hypothetical protein HN587_04605 [Candidatus Woesearchaeota archaeon]|jgi:hypothetical protein|nr:hypothetical protein [Candidatus Woesearchaeota archaeon]